MNDKTRRPSVSAEGAEQSDAAKLQPDNDIPPPAELDDTQPEEPIARVEVVTAEPDVGGIGRPFAGHPVMDNSG